MSYILLFFHYKQEMLGGCFSEIYLCLVSKSVVVSRAGCQVMSSSTFLQCKAVRRDSPAKIYCSQSSTLKSIWNKRSRRASLLPIIYFMGNRILLINFIVRMAAKSPFCLPSILLPEAMDKSGTPLRLMLRPPSFYQCPIRQVLSSGLDGTWQQPKGVECGISKIANYNSSWIY